jgi:predicted Fe-Mo cluster-binding NifX family protein
MKTMKIAIPTADGVLCPHFGHCERFIMLTAEDGNIVSNVSLDPPPHEPGVLPRWLAQQGANVVIAGGMGMRAQELFRMQGITVVVGAPSFEPEALVRQFLDGSLQNGENLCDH